MTFIFLVYKEEFVHFRYFLCFSIQVLLLNLLNDQLVVFCADNQIDIFNLTLDQSASCESIPSRFFFM